MTTVASSIPGLPDRPAFLLHQPVPSAIPVLIAAPHGGRHYPRGLTANLRLPGIAELRLEDRLTDRLAAEVGALTGAAVLIAHAPRALIDLNRHLDDIDWEMIDDAPRGSGKQPPLPGRRARGGLGLIPRRLPGFGEIWKGPLGHAELQRRIATVHDPYHQALDEALARLRHRWGAALLLDVHSMPPLPQRHRGEQAAHFVIGDRFSASCDGSLVAAAFAELIGEGWRAAHNRPYAGGYVLERHARPEQGIHAIQLEIDREAYLDPRMSGPGPGFGSMAMLLARLVRKLALVTAELGGRFDGRLADAAE